MTSKNKPCVRPSLRRPFAASLAGFALCFLTAAPPARAAEVTVSSGTTLRDQLNTLAGGGTVSFTGDGLNNPLQSVITLTSNLYVLNPGGAEHVTIMGRTGVGAFANTGDINLALSSITITRGEGSAIKSSAGTVNLMLAGNGMAELANNTASSHGGAIYGHTGITITGSQGSLRITGNNASGRAGALYAESGNIIIDTVVADTFLLANNTSPYSGGAIYAQGGTVAVSGTYGAIHMRGNVSRGGGGGALGANGTLVVNPSVSGEFLVTSNTAASGAAFYAALDMSITANGAAGIRIENNTATVDGGALWLGSVPHHITANSPAGIHFENNTAAGSGGAIFMNNGGAPLNLDAAQGDIVFQGNKHGAARTPNALYANSAGGNALNITGARDVLFLDPVHSNSADASSISKTGAGSVVFSGTSVWRGNAAVAAGALLVNNGALLDTAAAGRSLSLSPGAVLGTYATAGSGSIKADALALSGILYATGTSQLHLHGAATLNSATIRADVYPGNQSGRTVIHDTATFNGDGIIDLWSIAAASGTFTVFRYEAGVIPAGAFSGTLRYQGNIVGGAGAARVSGSVQLSADQKSVLVTLPGVVSNYVTWTGSTGASWDLTTENWRIGAIAATAAIGDHITFDDTADRQDVTIEGSRLDVSAMLVTGTLDYAFAGSGGVRASDSSIGGGIVAPGGPGIGKLVKDGAGKLSFANAGANTFENGIDWHAGVIAITSGSQLGVGAGAAINLLAAGGTLQASGTVASTLASDIVFAPGAVRSLTVENTGAALTLAGAISGNGGLVITGTGLTGLSGTSTFAGDVILLEGGALALAHDEALGQASNTLVLAGHARLVATGSFATSRGINLGAHDLDFSSATGGELVLAGAAGQLSGSGTIRLAGRLHAAAAGVLGAATNWDIAPGGLLALAGNQSVAGLRNNGAIQFRARGAVLTAASLAGSGTIGMEIDLNGGDANSRLVITGQADGRHYLDITAIGDPGSPRDVDIPLVTFAGGDATFSSNTIVSEDGMNAYEARQNGGNVNLVFAGNSASADVILVTAGALGMDWHYSLDSLRMRMGEVRSAVSPTGLIAGSGEMKGAMGDVWFRTSVYRVEIEPNVVGAAFDQTSYDISAGVDRAFALGNASLLVGGFATMTRSSRDHAANDSKSDSDGIGGGLYASWLAKNGWYLDAVAKYHRYENTIDASNDDRRITRGDYASSALGGSVELGRRFVKRRLWLEPSAQAALAWFDSGEYTATSTTGRSMRIRVDDSTSLQLRGQLRAGADFGRWQPYARVAGVSHTTDGGTIHVTPYEYEPDFSGWRFEAGAGVTLMVDERTIMYLDYEYNKADGYRRPWAVCIGIRRTW
ncbi:autotransporter outer membrane beta-barrel domain-containing protein [Termitidicoccus mucosus]|uniref:Autotransporter domain-containing protein n=1 Tax=Termitidicoccus mucosus TaxID=1184151 RepID=A0A178IDV1_9BACT|nr:hypothetical protein AW736_18200 [Opitutaceae bacterium TSB47]